MTFQGQESVDAVYAGVGYTVSSTVESGASFPFERFNTLRDESVGPGGYVT